MEADEIARIVAADCLCFRARRVSRLITRIYDEALRSLGVQSTQLTLLSAIGAAGKNGQTMGKMVDVLALDLATLSRNLRAIEQAGLVEVARLDTDKRVRIARLTSEGERKLAEALPLWRQAQAQVIALLGKDAAVDLRHRLDSTAAAAQFRPADQD